MYETIARRPQSAGWKCTRSQIVRTLTGLEVIGLDYPGHIATAVRFTSDVPGDVITYDGKRFVVRGPGNIEIEAEGYSARDVRRLLGSAAELVEQQDATWKRAIEAGDVGPAVIDSGEQPGRSATDVGDDS